MLREDNADLRLTGTGRKLGLIDDDRWDRFSRKRDTIATGQERLRSGRLGPGNVNAVNAERILGKSLEREHTLIDLLRRPDMSYRSLSELAPDLNEIDDPEVVQEIEIQAKYEGYIGRQRDEILRREAQESQRIPSDLDYTMVRGLSNEVRQTLSRCKPQTIGQAGRISGVTPAAISLLLVHLKRDFRPKKKSA